MRLSMYDLCSILLLLYSSRFHLRLYHQYTNEARAIVFACISFQTLYNLAMTPGSACNIPTFNASHTLAHFSWVNASCISVYKSAVVESQILRTYVFDSSFVARVQTVSGPHQCLA